MYAAQTGTFAQRDPLPQGGPILGYSDRAVAKIREKLRIQSSSVLRASVNLYEYVFGNPISSTDPSGLLQDCDALHIDCFNECYNKPKKCFGYPIDTYKGKTYKWAKYAYCEVKCLKEYADCNAENALETAFATVEDALDWLSAHPEIVVGTIVVVAGVAFIVSTGGSGAAVLIPLAI